MTRGPVRVMEVGVAVMLSVDKVANLDCLDTDALLIDTLI